MFYFALNLKSRIKGGKNDSGYRNEQTGSYFKKRCEVGKNGARLFQVRSEGNPKSSKDQNRFIEVVETQLLAVHEGNMANYDIKPKEFIAWKRHWNC